MADQVPIRADLDGSSLTGLAIFSSGETVGVAHGGTGLGTVATDNILTGNGTSALTSESNLTFSESSGDYGLAIGGADPHTYSGADAIALIGSTSHANSDVVISTTTAGTGTLTFTDTADDADQGKIHYSHPTDIMQFFTAATARMSIDSAGRVGIGGTPTRGGQFEIQGANVYQYLDATGHVGIHLDRGSTSYDSGLSFQTAAITNWRLAQMDADNLLQVWDDINESAVMSFVQGGSVGIGTAAPNQSLLHVNQTTSGIYTARFTNNQMDGPTVWINHTGATSTTNPVLAVSGAGTDALQVKSNGAFFLSRQGTGSGATDTGWYMTGCNGQFYGASPLPPLYLSKSNTGTILGFRYNDTYVGQVSITTGATSYQSASDYRLKENIVDLINATDRVAQLQPRRFNWKVDPDVITDGFIAHEVESIVPEAVSGTKDDRRTIKDVIAAADGTKIDKNVSEEDWEEGKTDTLYTAEDTIPDGKEIGDVKTSAKYPSDSTWEAEREVDWYQSMDNAKLVPVLTAAIQELTVRLEAAEAKITTLEAAQQYKRIDLTIVIKLKKLQMWSR